MADTARKAEKRRRKKAREDGGRTRPVQCGGLRRGNSENVRGGVGGNDEKTPDFHERAGAIGALAELALPAAEPPRPLKDVDWLVSLAPERELSADGRCYVNILPSTHVVREFAAAQRALASCDVAARPRTVGNSNRSRGEIVVDNTTEHACRPRTVGHGGSGGRDALLLVHDSPGPIRLPQMDGSSAGKAKVHLGLDLAALHTPGLVAVAMCAPPL